MKLPLIELDKANHFIYGNILALIFSLFLSIEISLLAVFAVANGKEIYDKVSGKGTLDIMDVVWTMFGAITIFIATTFS